jgi:hypothetical protein
MERSYYICTYIGYLAAKNPGMTAEDLKIAIDERLIECHFTPLGTEPGDVQLLEDVISETFMSVIGRGFNRAARRVVLKK